MGPTVTRPVQDPLAATRLEIRLYIPFYPIPINTISSLKMKLKDIRITSIKPKGAYEPFGDGGIPFAKYSPFKHSIVSSVVQLALSARRNANFKFWSKIRTSLGRSIFGHFGFSHKKQ